MERIDAPAGGAAASACADRHARLFCPFVLRRTVGSIGHCHHDGLWAFLCLQYLAREHLCLPVSSRKKPSGRASDRQELCRVAVIMRLADLIGSAVVAVGFLVMGGCAPTKVTTAVSPALDQYRVRSVVIMPFERLATPQILDSPD